MKISILAVGTELLMGKTLNTNATYLSKSINDLGHSVMYHMTVGDNPGRLSSTLTYLLSVSDMVITTGGLGPTQDDLTKESIAKSLELSLIKDEEAYSQMLERFKLFNVKMTENNEKQAFIPEGSIPMYNEKGTAPGFISSSKDKIVAALPGPPHEMKHMFQKSLKPYLKEQSEGVILSEYINLFGIGESSAESLINYLVAKQSNPSIAIYANIGQVSIRVTAFGADELSATELLKPTVKKLSERLEDYIVGYGESSITDITSDLMIKHNLTLSLAESCTGGLIASEFTKRSGASAFFDSSYITYSNKAKMNALNVSKETLDHHGAVSEETCKEMVLGLSEVSKSDICVSVTGVAGPTGGTADKPVGLVYIGINYLDQLIVKKYNFTGDRSVIQRRSLLSAINLIRKEILNTCK